MDKNIIDRSAICPYYKASDKDHIKCEGIMDNTSMTIGFGNRKDKAIYFSKYCCLKMNNCAICKILNKKYGVEYV